VTLLLSCRTSNRTKTSSALCKLATFEHAAATSTRGLLGWAVQVHEGLETAHVRHLHGLQPMKVPDVLGLLVGSTQQAAASVVWQC
jgi:hypothetical protein